ncbi:mechanosensitive ion channel domain-containing protein [Spirochaetia bacterium 38H-sp]|uniref:Mechanosensitive ion channel domain-containing protein n=1 Tax=Rarispira pelagica TaxID=3141764 RepID=A0ABU9UDJ8_9SPIR
MNNPIDLAKKILSYKPSIADIQFPFSVGDLLIGFILPILLTIIIYKLIIYWLGRILTRAGAKEETRTTVKLWVRRILRFFAFIIVFFLAFNLFGARIAEYLGKIYKILNEPILSSGQTNISLITIFMLIPVMYLATASGNITRSFLEKYVLDRVKNMDPSRRFTIASLTRYVVIVISAIIGLSFIGINISSLFVLLGVLGLGIGFGLQGLVANFFAGLIIISTRPIKEGDRILIGDVEGTVKEIRMLTTVVNTLLNESIILPNSRIVDQDVYNYSHFDRQVILRIPYQVSYNSDLHLVKNILLDAASQCPYRYKRKQADVLLRSFDSSGITMTLLVWINNVDDKYYAISWLNFYVWEQFKKHSIEIPYPQTDVHIKTLPDNITINKK